MKRKILTVLISTVCLVLAVVLAYVAYVFLDYHRIPDQQSIAIEHAAPPEALVEPGVTYTATSYNIGFGAYTPDFSFFMDGGEQSRAVSKESVMNCTTGAAQAIAAQQPDFALFQELDRSSTRSWHVDQLPIISEQLPGYDRMFAVNYDSAYLFYPLTQPHGKSLSGLAVFARFPSTSALRRSLPITTSVMKLIDLDRAYVVTRYPMSDGRELVVYNIHMTAYTSDASIRDAQLSMLVADMTAEYEAGNAVICGGDYNMEMMDPVLHEDTADWARPLDRAGLGVLINAWDMVPAATQDLQAGTCRDAGETYLPGRTTEWKVDSFIVSPNVTVEKFETLDLGYTYSDHNPVKLTFRIQ